MIIYIDNTLCGARTAQKERKGLAIYTRVGWYFVTGHVDIIDMWPCYILCFAKHSFTYDTFLSDIANTVNGSILYCQLMYIY